MITFKEEFCRDHTFKQRYDESAKVLSRFPEKIPVIVYERDNSLKLDKHKFLVPRDLTCAQLLFVIRKRLDTTIHAEKALFLGCKDTIVQGNIMLFDIYDTYKDPDGFLYVSLFSENTFG